MYPTKIKVIATLILLLTVFSKHGDASFFELLDELFRDETALSEPDEESVRESNYGGSSWLPPRTENWGLHDSPYSSEEYDAYEYDSDEYHYGTDSQSQGDNFFINFNNIFVIPPDKAAEIFNQGGYEQQNIPLNCDDPLNWERCSQIENGIASEHPNRYGFMAPKYYRNIYQWLQDKNRSLQKNTKEVIQQPKTQVLQIPQKSNVTEENRNNVEAKDSKSRSSFATNDSTQDNLNVEQSNSERRNNEKSIPGDDNLSKQAESTDSSNTSPSQKSDEDQPPLSERNDSDAMQVVINSENPTNKTIDNLQALDKAT